MTIWTNYHLAKDIPDALQALAHTPGPARLISGGTDLLLDLQQGRHPPVHTLVDVTRIPDMISIEFRQASLDIHLGVPPDPQEYLYLGAAVPLSQVIASPFVRQHAEALYEAASLIGGPQVRNTATLGGNVAHALPAGDGTIALLALDARAEVVSLDGCRYVPMRELFAGPGRSTIDPRREILAGFYLPLRGMGQGSAFRRVMRPQGVAIAILNLGLWLERDADKIADVRIAVGPSGPTPFRALGAEGALREGAFSERALANASEALLQEARFRTSPHRSSAEYRREMSAVLLRETFMTAWERAINHVQG